MFISAECSNFKLVRRGYKKNVSSPFSRHGYHSSLLDAWCQLVLDPIPFP